MRIIGFGGLASAGKSTCAHALAAELVDKGYKPYVMQFAGRLKRASNDLGFVKGGEFDALYRKFCQFTGAMAREADPDWWVKLTEMDLREHQLLEGAELADDGPFRERVLIFDDVRYLNEIELIRKWGGNLVFVDRYKRLEDRLSEEMYAHESEALALAYSRGELEDETFDMILVSSELEPMLRTVKTMAEYMIGSTFGGD